LERNIAKLGLTLLGYRVVPTSTTKADLGPTSSGAEPQVEQVFVKCPETITDNLAFERKLYILRNYSTRLINESVSNINNGFYFTTLSSKTICYKGQLTYRTGRFVLFRLSKSELVLCICSGSLTLCNQYFPFLEVGATIPLT